MSIERPYLKTVLDTHECIQSGDFTMAVGIKSNVKIEFDRIDPNSADAMRFAVALAEEIKPYKPDLLVAVPTGADNYIPHVSRALRDIPFAILGKPTERPFGPIIPPHVRDMVGVAERIAIIDDIRSTGYSTEKTVRALATPKELELGKIVVAGVFVDRGIDVDESIETLEYVALYADYHPDQPIAHLRTKYPWVSALNLPLPVRVTQT